MMVMQVMNRLQVLLSATCIITASAEFELQLSEIWTGQSGSVDVSVDWIELVNVGDTVRPACWV